jgi:starch synthase
MRGKFQTPACGCGLEGLLQRPLRRVVRHPQRHRCRRLESGNRHADRLAFSPTSLPARAPNKAALRQRFALTPDPDRLLFGVVSRLAWYKGIDILADALPALLGRGAQLVVLGTGEPELEQRLRGLADGHGGRVGCLIGYDEDLAHLIQAGSDAVLVPSRFEPCGLTQLCAMHYGAVPIAGKVGGLADTIVDPGEAVSGAKAATGLHFFPGDPGRARSRAASRRRPLDGPSGLARPAGERHAGRRVLGRTRSRLFRPLFRVIGV